MTNTALHQRRRDADLPRKPQSQADLPLWFGELSIKPNP